MRVLITGATGLIGQEIVNCCHEKHIAVNYLTTQQSKIQNNNNYQGFYWNPDGGEIDTDCFKDVDTIINLAGATIAKRWTSKYKKKIVSSRTESAALLLNSLKTLSHNVKHIISASAIGIYPDSLTQYYDESFSGSDDSFLNQVVTQWEAAVNGFSKLNIKVSKIRIGLVLSHKGGALPKLIKPIKLGLGAAFGSGEQWQSWIHIQDLAQLFIYVLTYQLEGIFNGVAPNPVSHKALIKNLAIILKSPLLLPNIPKFVMKLILGDMHSLLFVSQRVSSKTIENKGFYFKYSHLELALLDLCTSRD